MTQVCMVAQNCQHVTKQLSGKPYFSRDGVLKDWPRPRGQLEDKILWPWPRKPLALALTMCGLDFGFEIWP